ncbi:MAG: hypothetical protein IJW19_03220 [Clostridia bacterium]|nr:hypothetical protein [Clostridia bacterium]
MIKKLILPLMLLFVCVLMTSCDDPDDYVYDGHSLVGKWQEVDFDEGFYKTYEFKADGTVTYAYCTYGMITDSDSGIATYDYRVDDNNVLVIIEEYNGKIAESKVQFMISEDGDRLKMYEDGDKINELERYKLEYDDPSPLLGKWVSVNQVNGATQTDLFWFSENSECFIFPNVSGKIGDDVDEFTEDYINSEIGFVQTMLYSTKKNEIYLCFADEYIVQEESVIFGQYRIENDQLIISSDGKTVVVLERLDDDTV